MRFVFQYHLQRRVFGGEGPERYPKGYYGFLTRIRTLLFIGQRLLHHFKGKTNVTKALLSIMS